MTRLVSPVLPRGSLNKRDQPVLAIDQQLAMRPWTIEDVPALVDAYSDPEIQRWNLFSCDSAEAVTLIMRWKGRWNAETGADWAVAQKPDGMVIGRVWLRFIELTDGEAEIAYWVAPQARGRGVASKAAASLSSWLLDDLGLHRVQLGHSVQNVASCRVATNAGFVLEGTRNSALLHADGWHDMHWHAKIGV